MCGCFSAISSSRNADPEGFRKPCSHLDAVALFTYRSSAKIGWLTLRRLRIERIRAGLNVDGFCRRETERVRKVTSTSWLRYHYVLYFCFWQAHLQSKVQCR